MLVIKDPSTTGQPLLVDSANFRFDSFMSVGIQTLVFPSDETKETRKRDNPNLALDEINYEVRTRLEKR
jgi:hypothetical protein